MKKETVLKRALFVSLICTAIFAVTFIALFLLLPTTSNNTFGAVEQDIGKLFTNFSQAFVSLFDSQARATYQMEGLLSESGPLTIAALLLVLTAVLFTWLVFMIIFLINKKHPRYILFATPYILVSFISLLVVSTGGYLNAQYIKRASELVPVASGLIVMVYFVIISGALSFVGLVTSNVFAVTYFLEKGKESEVVEIEESEPTVAEEAGDVEAVEEAAEIPAPEVANIEESEPEPIPEADEMSMIEEADEPEIEEEPLPEAKVEEEPKEEQVDLQNMNKDSLAALLKEVVRDIVRDEMARNNPGNQAVTGATFGGPLVVQYFNGGINAASPEEGVVEKKVETPKKEEVKEEVKPEKAPLFVKKEVVEPANEVIEEKKYDRLTFAERLLQSDKEVHDLYNEIKNEILSYGVKSRISAVGDTFRLHKKMYVRITVAGKSLKLYFALNPRDYANSTLPIQDASNKEMYVDIPLCFKVRSPLSIRRCKELIQDVMDKDRLEQGEIGKVNWVKELKAELASGKKEEKDED